MRTIGTIYGGYEPSCRTRTAEPEFFKRLIKEPRARILKLLRSLRIDSKEPIPLGFVAWRAGTSTLFLLGY